MNSLICRIKKHEGLRLKPYLDSVGKSTVGYGRNLDDVGISEDEAEDLLINDINKAEQAANQFNWFRELDYVRKGVVIEMIFNLGLPRFLGFKKMIQALREKDFEEAAKEMLDSKWHEQVKSRALTLSEVMISGLMVDI